MMCLRKFEMFLPCDTELQSQENILLFPHSLSLASHMEFMENVSSIISLFIQDQGIRNLIENESLVLEVQLIKLEFCELKKLLLYIIKVLRRSLWNNWKYIQYEAAGRNDHCCRNFGRGSYIFFSVR